MTLMMNRLPEKKQRMDMSLSFEHGNMERGATLVPELAPSFIPSAISQTVHLLLRASLTLLHM